MMTSNKLKNIIFFLVVLAIFTPLLAHQEFIFPYIYLKNIAFRALVLLMVFFIAWYAILNKKLVFKKHYILYALASFVFVQFLATIFGKNIYNSFWSNFERMEGWIYLFLLLILFLVLINIFHKTKDWVAIFRFSIMVSSAVILYDIFGRLGWISATLIQSSSGTIGNTSFFGGYLLFNTFFAGILFLIDKVKSWRIFYAVIFLLNFSMIFVNASRASVLGLLLGVIVGGVFFAIKATKKIKIFIALFAILIVMFSGLVFVQKDSSWVQNTLFLKRITDISSNDFSTMNRLLIWQVSFDAFLDRPILGYGPENAIYGLNKHYNAEISEQWFDRTHNFVLDNLLSAGILGLLSYLSIFVFTFIALFRYYKQNYALGSTLIALFVAYLFSNLFSFDSLVTWVPLILILGFVDFISSKSTKESSILFFKEIISYKNYFIGLFLIILFVSSYFIVIKPTQANMLGLDAARNINVDTIRSLEWYKQAFDYNTFGQMEIALALSDNVKQILLAEESDGEMKKSFIEESERQILAILQKDPHNIRMRMILADMYLDFAVQDKNYTDKAIELLNVGIDDSPERLEIYAILARAYMENGDVNKALEYLETSLNIYDGREQDYLNIVYLFYKSGDSKKIDQYIARYLNRFPDISILNYNTFSRYYLNMNMGQELLESGMLDRLTAQDPENVSHHLLVIDAYYKSDQISEVIKYISGIAEHNEELANQLTKYSDIIKQ